MELASRVQDEDVVAAAREIEAILQPFHEGPLLELWMAADGVGDAIEGFTETLDGIEELRQAY